MSEYRLGIYEKAMPANIDWLERLVAVREAGFDFVEISIDETEPRQARLDWTKAERMQLMNTVQITGLPIRTMCLSAHRKYPLGSHRPEVRRRGMEIMEKAIQLACDLGIRIIQLAGYDVYYEDGDAETHGYFLENLKKCAQMASAAGVLMGFETMETPFMDTVSKAMRYVHEVESPYLGVYPDLGNLTNAARIYGLRVTDEIEAGRGHIVAMHIKETKAGRYRDMRFGTGEVQFVPGIAAARAQGVNYFVAECWYDGAEDWRGSIQEVNRFVRGCFR